MKIDKVKTKCGVRQILTMIRYTHVQMFFLVFRFVVQQLLTTYQIFHEIAPIFKYLQIKGIFLKHSARRAHPHTFYILYSSFE